MELTLEISYQHVLLEKLGKNNYPPYDFYMQLHDNQQVYVLEIAAAGFLPQELKVEIVEDFLIISSFHQEDDLKQYIHKGIGRRNFKQMFKMHNSLKITEKVGFHNGILKIVFRRKEEQINRVQIFPIDEKLKLS